MIDIWTKRVVTRIGSSVWSLFLKLVWLEVYMFYSQYWKYYLYNALIIFRCYNTTTIVQESLLNVRMPVLDANLRYFTLFLFYVKGDLRTGWLVPCFSIVGLFVFYVCYGGISGNYSFQLNHDIKVLGPGIKPLSTKCWWINRHIIMECSP